MSNAAVVMTVDMLFRRKIQDLEHIIHTKIEMVALWVPYDEKQSLHNFWYQRNIDYPHERLFECFDHIQYLKSLIIQNQG